MYLKEELEKYKDELIRLYLDMDGTICDYDIGNADDYEYKRPLVDRINIIKEVNEYYDNITLYILSVCQQSKNIVEKNRWLDRYLPEIKYDNRIILLKNKLNGLSSADLKSEYLTSASGNTREKCILIDDDVRVIKKLRKYNPDIILYKDSVLSD